MICSILKCLMHSRKVRRSRVVGNLIIVLICIDCIANQMRKDT